MSKLSILTPSSILSCSLYILLHCSLPPLALTHENVNVLEPQKPPAPGIPPPQVNYVENPDNEPGVTDNYTMSVLNSKDVRDESEREHIQEHLKDTTLDTSKMTRKELQFHYFKIQDTDNNKMLDGTEICKSMMHHHENELDVDGLPKIFSDDDLTRVVDTILYHDDANDDGFIDYAEFKQAQDRIPD